MILTSATDQSNFKELPNITPDFGNSWLSNAHEILLPDAISYFPQASVLVFIWLLIFLFGGCAWWAMYRRRQSTLYQRQALTELSILQRRLESDDHYALAELPHLLKRVAFCVWPRIDLVKMNSDEWFHFWRATSGTAVPPLLRDVGYRSRADLEQITKNQCQQLMSWSHHWISEHHRKLGQSVSQLLTVASDKPATSSSCGESSS